MRYKDEVRHLHEKGYVFSVYWDRFERIAEVAAVLHAGRKETGVLWVRGEVPRDTLRRLFKALEELQVPYESVEGAT